MKDFRDLEGLEAPDRAPLLDGREQIPDIIEVVSATRHRDEANVRSGLDAARDLRAAFRPGRLPRPTFATTDQDDDAVEPELAPVTAPVLLVRPQQPQEPTPPDGLEAAEPSKRPAQGIGLPPPDFDRPTTAAPGAARNTSAAPEITAPLAGGPNGRAPKRVLAPENLELAEGALQLAIDIRQAALGQGLELPGPEYMDICRNRVASMLRRVGRTPDRLNVMVDVELPDGSVRTVGVTELTSRSSSTYWTQRAALNHLALDAIQAAVPILSDAQNLVLMPEAWLEHCERLLNATNILLRYPPKPEGGLAALNRVRRERAVQTRAAEQTGLRTELGLPPAQEPAAPPLSTDAVSMHDVLVRAVARRDAAMIAAMPSAAALRAAEPVFAGDVDRHWQMAAPIREFWLKREAEELGYGERRSNGKRDTLTLLEARVDGWRDDFWKVTLREAARGTKVGDHALALYVDAVAVLMTAGPRPCELARAVTISLNPRGDFENKHPIDPATVDPENPGDAHLTLRAQGGKYNLNPNNPRKDKGQEWRCIQVLIDQPEARHLANLIKQHGNGHAVPIADPGFFKDVVRKIGHMMFDQRVARARTLKTIEERRANQRGISITPYVFRHSFSACSKATPGIPDEQVSFALSHASAPMKSRYGNPVQLKGSRNRPGPTFAGAYAPKPVRGSGYKVAPAARLRSKTSTTPGPQAGR